MIEQRLRFEQSLTATDERIFAGVLRAPGFRLRLQRIAQPKLVGKTFQPRFDWRLPKQRLMGHFERIAVLTQQASLHQRIGERAQIGAGAAEKSGLCGEDAFLPRRRRLLIPCRKLRDEQRLQRRFIGAAVAQRHVQALAKRPADPSAELIVLEPEMRFGAQTVFRQKLRKREREQRERVGPCRLDDESVDELSVERQLQPGFLGDPGRLLDDFSIGLARQGWKRERSDLREPGLGRRMQQGVHAVGAQRQEPDAGRRRIGALDVGLRQDLEEPFAFRAIGRGEQLFRLIDRENRRRRGCIRVADATHVLRNGRRNLDFLRKRDEGLARSACRQRGVDFRRTRRPTVRRQPGGQPAA